MNHQCYQYRFARTVPAGEIEDTLMLALLAVESLHGSARVRMDGRCRFDKERHVCEIETGTRVGSDLAEIFTGFITVEFGEVAVSITKCGMQNAECGNGTGPKQQCTEEEQFRNPHSSLRNQMGVAS